MIRRATTPRRPAVRGMAPGNDSPGRAHPGTATSQWESHTVRLLGRGQRRAQASPGEGLDLHRHDVRLAQRSVYERQPSDLGNIRQKQRRGDIPISGAGRNGALLRNIPGGRSFRTEPHGWDREQPFLFAASQHQRTVSVTRVASQFRLRSKRFPARPHLPA